MPDADVFDLLPEPSTDRPKNVYIDRALARPQLWSGPDDGLERSLSDRLKLNLEASRRSTLLGAGEAAVYGNLPEDFDPSIPGDVENRARSDRITQSNRQYEAMKPARTPLEYLAAGAGQIAGATTSPESFATLPFRFVTSGATAASRVLRAGVSGAAVNAAIDPGVQALRQAAGLQEGYDPRQTAASAALGFALPAAGQGLVEAIRPGPRRVPSEVAAATASDGSVSAIPAQPADAPASAPVPPVTHPESVSAPRTPAQVQREDGVPYGDAARIAEREGWSAGARAPEPDVAPDIAPAIARVVNDETVPDPAVTALDEAAALVNEAKTATAARLPLDEIPAFDPASVPPTPGKRAGVFLFNPNDLLVDANTFQFKSGGNDQGVTPILRGVSRWDADAAGQIVVWQRNDGALFVADGHQRAGLARRMLNGGTETEIKIPGSLYREADGWSAEQIMVTSALKNIREGSGDVIDAGRILRTDPAAAEQISEISRTQTRQAVALANLSEAVWRMTVNDVIEPRHAAVIGRLIQGNDDLQQAAAKLLVRVQPASEAEAEILVRRVRDSELVEREGGSQESMFGDMDGPDSLVAEETRIVSQTIKTLARDKNILKRVAVNADRIEETGSRIERSATEQAADEASRLSEMVEGLAFTRGTVRDSLLELARGLKNGSITAPDAAESFVQAVRLGSPIGDAGGRAARRRGSGDADEGARILGYSQQLRGRPLTGDIGRPAAGVAAGTTPSAQRLKDISESIVKTLGLTVRQGRIGKRGALGTYNEASGVVRLRDLDAFEVLQHEGGHAFHLRPANKPEIDRLIDAHSVEIERLAYAGAKQGEERVEGFAEWFRMFMTNPAYAAREAPTFTAAFSTWMETNRKDTFDLLREAQGAYRDWLQAPSGDLVTGDLVSSSAPPLKTRVARAVGPDQLPNGMSLFGLFDRFYTRAIDHFHPVYKAVVGLSRLHEINTGQRVDIRAADDAYKLMRLGSNAYQGGHADLIYGVVPYRGVDPNGPSLGEAMELAVGKNWFGSWRNDEMLDFGGYLVARRSIVEFERFLRGEVPNPPGKLTMGDYRQAVADYEAAHPQFMTAATLVYEWQTNLLTKKLDAGLVSQSYYDGAMAKADYVPFKRDFSEKVEDLIRSAGTQGTNRQSAMKAYRGSLRSIINPIESMIADAYDTAAIISRNDAIKALANMARTAGPDGGAIAEIIPPSQLKPIKVDLIEALRVAGKDAGLNKDDLDDLILTATETLDADDVRVTLYKAGEAPEKGEPVIYFWEGGERKALRLPDKRFGRELYEAITGQGKEQSNWIIDVLSVPARGLRIGITTSPEFILANYLRDQVTAFVLNPKFIPFVSGARGIGAVIAQGVVSQGLASSTGAVGRAGRASRLYAQSGGIMAGVEVASLNKARVDRSITALQKKGFSIARLKDFREVLKLTEVSETGTRIALFKQYFDTSRKQGLSEYESVVEAAFQASDSMDFGRHGSKMLAARRIVTFLNAALQGTDKTGRVLFADLRPMARVFKGETLLQSEKARLSRSGAAWAKLAALTALSATYAAFYRDEPEFQEASEYLRATHWLFKLPGGTWAVVPKPFEMATLINLGERLAEGMMANDATWADKWVRSWSNTLAVPVEPAGLMVPAEIGFNYDTFRNRPIVQQWDIGKDPALQYYSWTSEFSKSVGAAIGVSPAKLDHLITGWTGSWGRNALSASNSIMDPQRRSDALYDWPVTGRFVKNLARGSDATEKFYDLLSDTSGRLEVRNNSYKAMLDRGQEAEAESYYATLRDDEKVWVALNAQEKTDNKRIHPLRRASDIGQVLSGLRRDITNRNVRSAITERPLAINPTIAQAVNEQLMRAATAEMRNAMIAVNEPGWAQREIIDTQPYYEAIHTLSPEIGQEIDDRLGKKNVLPFDGVRSVWPELRERLLGEGPDAYISDLRADALRAPNPKRSIQ